MATRNRSQFQNLPPPPLTCPPLHSLLPSGWPLSSLGAACGLPHTQATADPLPHPEHPTRGICKIRYPGSALTHPGAQDALFLLPLTDGETQTLKARCQGHPECVGGLEVTLGLCDGRTQGPGLQPPHAEDLGSTPHTSWGPSQASQGNI